MSDTHSYSAKDELLKVARVICDAFDYNPGHSDLDANQPIWIGVTLGDWRKLHFALATIKSESESSGPNWIASSEKPHDSPDDGWYIGRDKGSQLPVGKTFRFPVDKNFYERHMFDAVLKVSPTATRSE